MELISPQKIAYLEDDPLWYKDAVIYELHVRAFYDSNGDGIGDFPGLTQKLDHLENLGITAIWLLPFYPSPLRDDGYDIANYFDVHPDYGTLRDFKEFLKEAHRRGIRVITELVLNHTSDQHEWFQRARRAKPGSKWRNFYVWDSPQKYQDARIIFKDFETSNWAWDPLAKTYYWHRFYSHQPDLNYDHPPVQKAMLRVIDYWLNMGVDGLRLDAVPYLFEREGTNCENLPETFEFLKKLRAHIDSRFKGRMLLAEANQWPEDAVNYFGQGDECHMAFHFPLMPRMFMAIRMENRYPIIEILDQTPPIPDVCQWALFLRNHDELTLEMVTDEERDYMYRIYAKDRTARINLGIRRRLAPLLENDRRKIELMNFLLLSLPGTPVIYYGDEIGMGDNYYLGDRNGVRTPMQWSGDRNAGFSRANPQKLYLPVIIDPEYHYEAVNVENQDRSQSSLLWWMRHFIAMRNNFKAFGRGRIEFLYPENMKILAFIRQYQDENILVVVNLSRHPQLVELDLSKYAGYVPVEAFSKNPFLAIREHPYALTLGSYGYYLFLLERQKEGVEVRATRALPQIQVSRKWEMLFEGKAKEVLEGEILPLFLKNARWFGGKMRRIQQVKIVKDISVGKTPPATHLLFLEVQYTEGVPDMYLLPLSFAQEDQGQKIIEESPHGVIAKLAVDETRGIIYDGLYSPKFRHDLLMMVVKRLKVKDKEGELAAYPGKALRDFIRREQIPSESQVLRAEQSNSSILYGNKFFLKLFRRLEEGMNSELEMLWFLTEKLSFPHVPSFAGVIEYRKPKAEPLILAIVQGFVPNAGDAWSYILDALEGYFGMVLSKVGEIKELPKAPASPLEAAYQEIPPLFQELMSAYLDMISILGKRTAELHLALAEEPENPHFALEPYSLLHQRAVYQSLQTGALHTLQLLEKSLSVLPAEERKLAEEILSSKKQVISKFKAILQKKICSGKIRIHGDYHLGQVLYTGKDFVIIDFEGEPARSLSERRIKRSPLRDVAGMLRSLHYAAYTALLKKALIRAEDRIQLEPWAELWYKYSGGTFLRSYLDTAKDAPFIPKERNELRIMLDAFLLDKAIYEIGYELNNRPDWVAIPLRGVKRLLEEKE